MPQYPVVLAHGYLGFANLGPAAYFGKVFEQLRRLGATEIHVTNVAPKASIQERSGQLAQQIRHYVPNGKVNLVAHSMGGLDARFLIRHGEGRELFASFIALGTPFRGTAAADVATNPLRLAESPS